LTFAIVVYSVACCIAQYFGSISALCFGISGENTSAPILAMRKKLDTREAIRQTAIGSFVASIITVCGMYLSVDFIMQQTAYLTTYLTIGLICVGLIMSVIYAQNAWYMSFGMIVFGLLLGRIGYDSVRQESFLTFDSIWLYAGLPVLPVIMGLLAIPALVSFRGFVYSSTNIERQTQSSVATIVRSTFVGAIMGLIPYLGSTISSMMAVAAERKFKPNDVMAHAVASESANNAAALTVLIPLIAFGIAIVPSEWILLEILTLSNIVVDFKSVFGSLVVALVFANIIAYFISRKISNHFIQFMVKYGWYMSILLLIGSLVGVYVFGEITGQGLFYLTLLALFSIVGVIFRNYDVLPIVFGFLVSSHLESTIRKFIILYL
jgi:TctA family transporter